jgi:hypothetical protein
VIGKYLGDILGAADLPDFVMEVQNVSATSPLLMIHVVELEIDFYRFFHSPEE